jgi:hypothetical protein
MSLCRGRPAAGGTGEVRYVSPFSRCRPIRERQAKIWSVRKGINRSAVLVALVVAMLTAAGCGVASHAEPAATTSRADTTSRAAPASHAHWTLGNCGKGCPYEGAQAKSPGPGGPFSAFAGDDCTRLSYNQIALYVKGQIQGGFPGLTMKDVPWITNNIVNDCSPSNNSGPLYLLPVVWSNDSQQPGQNSLGGGTSPDSGSADNSVNAGNKDSTDSTGPTNTAGTDDFPLCQETDVDWSTAAAALINAPSDPAGASQATDQLSQDLLTLAVQAIAANSPDAQTFASGGSFFKSDSILLASNGTVVSDSGGTIPAVRSALTKDCGLQGPGGAPSGAGDMSATSSTGAPAGASETTAAGPSSASVCDDPDAVDLRVVKSSCAVVKLVIKDAWRRPGCEIGDLAGDPTSVTCEATVASDPQDPYACAATLATASDGGPATPKVACTNHDGSHITWFPPLGG